ncbi:hypothetical protein JAAARDRAFT_117006 [Jaapia argillacea MUCL 33604]|uniref:Eukaryotic translation initiation factor 5B n=1 Tax=Jaapia argillacea MUCL 33604 TaxID=933084 RepID=A0A067QNG8_9AGAM|nr:hypothetical protein JAAARDRAFT_117006 [Jaapia argillacea MUCL 33604]
MPPKNKGKKSKKQDDDEFWEKAGESVSPNVLGSPAGGDLSDEEVKPKGKAKAGFGGFSSFAGMEVDDTPNPGDVDENEDFGGLMSVIKATSSKKKDKKKNKKFDDDEGVEFDGDAVAATKAPKEVTAEELADEEWGPIKAKGGKKGKKGKGKKGAAQEEEDEEEIPVEPAASPAPAPVEQPAAPSPAPKAEEDEEDEADEGGPKVLSKKEKEKLKKEREKKKAQAAAKKAATQDEVPAEAPSPVAAAAPTPAPPAPVPAAENDEEEEEGPGGDASKKKKKKKKGAKKEEEAPPAAASKKKGPAGISALKALMEEKKRLEEEARRKEEEERLRIEEEERKAEEEAKRIEEEKRRKKEKEKAKKEVAKKEGRLLTKKQKEEKAAADRRRQALLASGVQIEGLAQPSGGTTKKVVYDNRKRKPAAGAAPGTRESTPGPETKPETPEPQTPLTPAKDLEQEKKDEDVKSDWDVESEDEKPNIASKKEEDVKSDWDASSEDEEEKKAKKTAVAAPAAPPPKVTSQPKAAPQAAPTAKPASAPPAKATTAKANGGAEDEESSEEDDSEDDDDDDDSEEESSSDESEVMTAAQRLAAQRKAEAAERRAKAREEALKNRDKNDLRSPICCILGHVDTGKTKLLDKIRQTNVQEGEAGGITQQIGATYFPVDAIKTKTEVLNKDGKFEYKIPGLLVIDTPGHESFTNLRSRGSSLCNIAILVVDIMHGLEPQTLESLRLLRDRKTPFIVALNKIDRMYGWEPIANNSFQDSLAKQKRSVQREFEDRVQKTILAFAEQGLNAVLYYDNKNFARNVSLVPTSAITGEGIPDMIMLLVNLTQQRMSERLMYLSELECTVLEVKVIEGLGTTIDVVLVNGTMHEGDKIVVCGLNGPIVTQVRALLTPQPLRELRIKSAYVHHKEVKAALGVKISAPDLDKAIAGSRLLVLGPDDDEDDLKEEVMSDLTSLLNSIDKSGRGVCVQASTLGSLEALLEFLKTSKIPVSGINIGPIHKRDVMRAATMLEKQRELACILCFDVPVDSEAEKLAEEMGIRLFKADIIYHLFDAFTAYNNDMMEAKRKDAAPQAVWPCRLKIIAAFCKRDPIILGVDIIDGTLRLGTPLCVVKVDPVTKKKDIIDLGRITSLEINHKSQEVVKKSQAGGGVAVKIEHAVYQSAKMFGRHFDDKDEIVSHITRQSIDVMKSHFRNDVSNEEWLLIKGLKAVSLVFLASCGRLTDISKSGQDLEVDQASSVDQDELQMQKLGYKQQLHRTWHQFESFAASFAALNFIGGVRSALFLGLLAGGPAAVWSSYLITLVFMWITAAVLAEICSALPLSGSIYIWTAESAGPKYARFFGFLVAWWSTTAWMTFAAGNCQTTANYIVSQLAVWEVNFPGGITNDNVKWRAFIWAISEATFFLAIAMNYMPPKWYSRLFKFSVFIMMLDFFLCLIWLPIGASRSYGIRSASEVFTQTYNGTGAPAGWNWSLSFLFTAGTLIGFDASGHIAEETKNASVVAGRGILSSAIATGVLGFATTILFLFCIPDLDSVFALDAPQPFVLIYAQALGRGPSIFMTALAAIGLILNTSVAIVAASRLVFAVARDGVLPFSSWIGQVTSDGQPRNAVTVMFIFGSILLCSILPSQVAFTSLVSAGGVPTTAAYGLIALLRFTMTPNEFQGSYFRLGKYAKPFYVATFLFNGFIVAVQLSPFSFPVTSQTFNFACVIFGSVTVFAVGTWYFTPEEKWLPRQQVERALHSAEEPVINQDSHRRLD